MDVLDYFFTILIFGIFTTISCGITNENIMKVHKDVKELKAPIKFSEQLKIENLEKQLEKLTEKSERSEAEKVVCGQ